MRTRTGRRAGVRAPEKRFLINVSYINSTYIGMIAATFFQAQAKGKTLIVRAPDNVTQVLRAAGFEGFIRLEVTA